jgi:hypothetical protein
MCEEYTYTEWMEITSELTRLHNMVNCVNLIRVLLSSTPSITMHQEKCANYDNSTSEFHDPMCKWKRTKMLMSWAFSMWSIHMCIIWWWHNKDILIYIYIYIYEKHRKEFTNVNLKHSTPWYVKDMFLIL